MKRILFLLATALLLSGVDVLSQTITLSFKNASLETALAAVEKQAACSFIWNEKQIANTEPVNIEVKAIALKEALQLLLEPRRLKYKITGSVIVITGSDTNLVKNVPLSAAPQKTIVSGTIFNEEGEPIADATIRVNGASKGGVSDQKGMFSISIDEKAPAYQLLISCNGYKSQSLQATDRSPVVVNLVQTVAMLDQVMVSTGIFDRRKIIYSGAVSTITANDLKMTGTRTLLASIGLASPSVNILENNIRGSDPNLLPDVQIRGNTGIPNVNELQNNTASVINAPLVIVDGFESSLQRLMDMNPEEVLKITVLKDAAAASIYGSRGANGVIAVNTRPPQGGRDGRLSVSYRTDIMMQVADLDSYKMLKAREKLELENELGMYSAQGGTLNLDLKQYYNFFIGELGRGVETDWLVKPLQQSAGQKHSLRIDGGNNIFRFATSLQWNNMQGVMRGSFRKVANADMKLSYSKKNINILAGLGLSIAKWENSPFANFATFVKQNPYMRPYDDNGDLLNVLGYLGNNIHRYRWLSLPANPLYDAALICFDKNRSQIISNNLTASYNILPSLILKGRMSLAVVNNLRELYLPPGHSVFTNFDAKEKGSLLFRKGKELMYDGLISLEYTKKKVGHLIYAGLSVGGQEKDNWNDNYSAKGFSSVQVTGLTSYDSLRAAVRGSAAAENFKTRSLGITASLNYAFRNSCFMDVSLRVDGNSQFGAAKRFAPFWSVGGGVNLHKMPMIKAMNWFDQLVFRSAIGTVGAQKFQPYQSLRLYESYNTVTYYSWPGSRLIAMGNDQLRWQQVQKINIGFNMQLVDSRFHLAGDFYVESTRDLISAVELPISSGFASYISNIGQLRNKGMEWSMSYLILRGKKQNLSWLFKGTLASNTNRIISVSKALKDAQHLMAMTPVVQPVKFYREGYADNTIWTVPSLGIDPSTGTEVYLSDQGHPVFDWNGRYLKASGVSEPRYRGVISTIFNWRSFGISLAASYRLGGQLYDQTLASMVENANFNYNLDRRVLERNWRKPGDQSGFTALSAGKPAYVSSRFVYNETTLQLSNIQIMYELSSAIAGKLNFQSLRVQVNMSDLLYYSTVKRQRGVEYPYARQYSMAVSASF